MPENKSLAGRVARILRRVADRVAPSGQDTAMGIGALEDAENWRIVLSNPSRKRVDIYNDLRQMEDTHEEAATALDILADNVVNAEKGSDRTFTIVYDDDADVSPDIRDLIDDTIRLTRWREKAYQITRETLLLGDHFHEYVVNRDLRITRLMYLPPESVVRYEDREGLLRPGNGEDDCAFAQINPDTGEVVARFYPWQVEHIRWNRRGNDKYGRGLFYTGRTGWRKLRAMEEALVINWLTRAFARLLFILDVTGKSPQEAEMLIKKFKRSLSSQRISSGVETIDNLSVVKDIYIGNSLVERGGKVIPGLNDVKVLDTSNTGFWNLEAIRYYQGKTLTASRVPKAHMGLEKDVNAKSTLQLQDRRFARTIRRIQSVIGEAIRHTIELQLRLVEVEPSTVPYKVQWPAPSWMDEVDVSTFYKNMAVALPTLVQLGIIDPDYIALELLNIPPTQWEAIKRRGPPKGVYDDSDTATPGD